MLFRENNVLLRLTSLALALFCFATLSNGQNKAGYLAGSAIYVDEQDKENLGEASNVIVEMEFQGVIMQIVTNERGDLLADLAEGEYCLKSAYGEAHQALRFSPSQHRCFKIGSNQITRFDLMLMKPTEEVFDPIPAQLRARLAERMKILIEYQRKQQWDKQYELLSELVTQGDSKEEHVKRLQRWYAEGLVDNLVDFAPKSVAVHNASVEYGKWTIFGCATLREKGRVAEPYAAVSAYREKDDWYFSSIGVITPIDGKAQPCPYEKEKTSQNTRRYSKSRKVKY